MYNVKFILRQLKKSGKIQTDNIFSGALRCIGLTFHLFRIIVSVFLHQTQQCRNFKLSTKST